MAKKKQTNSGSPKYKSLGAAVKAGDVEGFYEVLDIIKKNQEISEKDLKKTMDVLLLSAVTFPSLDVIKALVKEGGNINAKGPIGESLLHMAAQFNQYEVFEWLTKNGLDVNTTDNNGNNAIMHWMKVQVELDTAEDGLFHYDFVKNVFANYPEFDINATNFSMHSFVHLAAMYLTEMHEIEGLKDNQVSEGVQKMIVEALERGATLTLEDCNNNTATQYIPNDPSFDDFFDMLEDYRIAEKKKNKTGNKM